MPVERGRAQVVRAAGVLPWRVTDGALQVALVHRPAYDDWSWAKGKLDRGEDPAVAAVRETLEETGLYVQLGRPLPLALYPLAPGRDDLVVKEVRYWAGRVVEDTQRLEHEIDEIRWLSPTLARQRLSYVRDQEQLDALARAHEAGQLTTWTLMLVRHARALPRGEWDGPDPLRPLDAVGARRAQRLAPILAAYGVERVLSSPSLRCTATVEPYAASSGRTVTVKTGLSEEGYEARPEKAAKHLRRMLADERSVAVCTHGPLFPEMLGRLAERAERPAASVLRRLAAANLDKGEALALSMIGTGDQARVLAAERHRPPRS